MNGTRIIEIKHRMHRIREYFGYTQHAQPRGEREERRRLAWRGAVGLTGDRWGIYFKYCAYALSTLAAKARIAWVCVFLHGPTVAGMCACACNVKKCVMIERKCLALLVDRVRSWEMPGRTLVIFPSGREGAQATGIRWYDRGWFSTESHVEPNLGNIPPFCQILRFAINKCRPTTGLSVAIRIVFIGATSTCALVGKPYDASFPCKSFAF